MKPNSHTADETPRTDEALHDYLVEYDEGGKLIALARQLERELAEARQCERPGQPEGDPNEIPTGEDNRG